MNEDIGVMQWDGQPVMLRQDGLNVNFVQLDGPHIAFLLGETDELPTTKPPVLHIEPNTTVMDVLEAELQRIEAE
jgi:hypothetical protein